MNDSKVFVWSVLFLLQYKLLYLYSVFKYCWTIKNIHKNKHKFIFASHTIIWHNHFIDLGKLIIVPKIDRPLNRRRKWSGSWPWVTRIWMGLPPSSLSSLWAWIADAAFSSWVLSFPWNTLETITLILFIRLLEPLNLVLCRTIHWQTQVSALYTVTLSLLIPEFQINPRYLAELVRKTVI